MSSTSSRRATTAVSGGETCARTFIQSFAAKAYRRPVTADDVDSLLDLYRAVAAEGGTYADGIDFVTRAILQAPSFVYLTELGDSTAGSPPGKTRLTPNEIASLLSYLMTANPPDQELLDDIASMATADGREQHLRRLWTTDGGRARLVRVVREWLGIDGIAELDKDSNVYPPFTHSPRRDGGRVDQLHRRGARKTARARCRSCWVRSGRIINAIYGATSEQIGAYYTDYYGLASIGPTLRRNQLDGAAGGTRVGILNQGAFLSLFATATGSHPVRRGVAVMRRLACLDLPDPAELDINVVPPVPDPNMPKTTRDLYAVHATDPLCKTCHGRIDNFGFAFELYDGMGAFRANRQEAVKTPTRHRDASGRHGDHRDGDGHRPRRRLRRQQHPGARPGQQRHRARLHGPPAVPCFDRAQRRVGAWCRGQLREPVAATPGRQAEQPDGDAGGVGQERRLRRAEHGTMKSAGP